MQRRVRYFSLALLTILAGLMSRRISWIPLCTGDALYAVMIFFLIRTAAINMSIKKSAILTLVITFLIEFSQLYQGEWISVIRKTLMGRLVLGQGFLVSDLVAYVLGAIVVATVVSKLEKEHYIP